MQAKVLTKKLKPLKIDTIKSRHQMQMNSMKYFMTMELNVTNMKLLEINENYGLDCEEFDDNVIRIKNQIDRLNQAYIQKANELNDKFGINSLNEKLESVKKETLKGFVDELALKKRDINQKINQLDVRIEAKINESEDEIKQKSKENRLKISEITKEYQEKAKELETLLVKKSETIEKELLDEFDKTKVKALLNKEKEIRKEYIENSSKLEFDNYSLINTTKHENEKSLCALKLLKKQEEFDLKLKKLELIKDSDEVVERIKARDDYYLSNTLDDSINYLNDLINQVKALVASYNEKAYLLSKDILQNKTKQIKFEDKEFSQIIKNITTIISSNLESLCNFYPQLIEFSSLKIEEKHYSKIIEAFNGFILEKKEFYLECSRNYLISQLELIRYINFDTSVYNDRLINEVSSYFDSLIEELNSLNSDCDNNKLKQMFKKYNQIDSSFAKIVKNVLKDILNDGKTYINQITKDVVIAINNETITTDELFKQCKLLDNSYSYSLISEYEAKINEYNESTLNVKKALSNVGVASLNAFNNSKSILDNELLEYKKQLELEVNELYLEYDKAYDLDCKNLKLEVKERFKYL